MGLSAIIPVLHGSRLYGLRQFNLSIGLSWLVLQGVLYIAGAAIYAVSLLLHMRTAGRIVGRLMLNRPVFRSGCGRAVSISGAARTRSSMCWWYWLRSRIWWGCSKHLTTSTDCVIRSPTGRC